MVKAMIDYLQSSSFFHPYEQIPDSYSRPSRFAWPSVEGFGHAIWEVMHSGESAYLQIIR